MADLERLYRRLPPTLQSLACSWQGWRIQRRRYNKDFHSLLATCQSRGALSESELTAFRDERLRSFIQHAAQTTPYYRPRLEECGVSAEDIRSLDDLQRLPVLSKAEVQENLTHLRSSQFAGHDTITTHTSGTTGRGLIFPVTLSAEREQWAIWWRYRIEHGIDIDTPCGVFGGRAIVSAQASKPPFWRYNSPARQILFSGYHLSEENLPAYVAEIRRSRLTWLHGYPSHLTLLAAHILDSGRDPGFQVTHITTGAESLLAHQREMIQRAFSCPVRQHYGLAEGVANISERRCGRLHVDEDFSAVEFMPREGADDFAIVGANFTNDAFPLIRYDTGDVARGVSEANDCPCGSKGRVVETIDGRVEDYVTLADGARVGRMDHIFKDMTMIREAQIYQREPGKILLRIVRAPEFGESDEKKLLQETEKRLGSRIHSEIRYVDRLPRGPGGKLRFVISDIPRAGIREEDS